jgi:hypothetical protein
VDAGKDVEGSGHGLFVDTIAGFSRRDQGKARRSSVMIVDLRAEI